MNHKLLLAAALLIAGTAYLYSGREAGSGNGAASGGVDRVAVYHEAARQGAAQAATWPKTEKDLIFTFWDTASRKDWDQLLLYTPGGTRDDFKIFEQFTPGRATAIGQPEPHPTVAGITLWPVTVPFPGYPKKTVKMSIVRTQDGRLIIDGQNTIWW